jgi:hypothetical protein
MFRFGHLYTYDPNIRDRLDPFKTRLGKYAILSEKRQRWYGLTLTNGDVTTEKEIPGDTFLGMYPGEVKQETSESQSCFAAECSFRIETFRKDLYNKRVSHKKTTKLEVDASGSTVPSFMAEVNHACRHANCVLKVVHLKGKYGDEICWFSFYVLRSIKAIPLGSSLSLFYSPSFLFASPLVASVVGFHVVPCLCPTCCEIRNDPRSRGCASYIRDHRQIGPIDSLTRPKLTSEEKNALGWEQVRFLRAVNRNKNK